MAQESAGTPDAVGSDQLGWLMDLAALRRLAQCYARAVDDRDLDSVGELFWPDAQIEGLRGTSDRDAYLEGLRSTPPVFEASMHVLADPLIDLQPGADEARLDTYAVVYQRGPRDPNQAELTLGMRYLDLVQRREGRWRIRHRRAVLVWRDQQ